MKVMYKDYFYLKTNIQNHNHIYKYNLNKPIQSHTRAKSVAAVILLSGVAGTGAARKSPVVRRGTGEAVGRRGHTSRARVRAG